MSRFHRFFDWLGLLQSTSILFLALFLLLGPPLMGFDLLGRASSAYQFGYVMGLLSPVFGWWFYCDCKRVFGRAHAA